MNPRLGTCSWKFESWVGLVYERPYRTAAQYLSEYSRRYRTAEIDSWFYRMPGRRTVTEYLENVDGDFRFTCKLPSAISLTHHRKKAGETELHVNDDFLSPRLFEEFLQAVEPMSGRLDAMMLEFEYLSRQKMPSLESFLEALDRFLPNVPKGVPLAIETRNKNYLKKEYFEFLRNKGLMHVFSEKIYMPHVYEVYGEFGHMLAGGAVIRLLGGDRLEMEKATGKKWDRLVGPRGDLAAVASMARAITAGDLELTINVNNHYEGSAPLTIERLEAELAAASG